LGPGTDAAAIDRCIAAWADLAQRRRSRAVA
jgi:cysteine desulfurase